MGLEGEIETRDPSKFVVYSYTPAFHVRRLKY